jgi:hypothetical protein
MHKLLLLPQDAMQAFPGSLQSLCENLEGLMSSFGSYPQVSSLATWNIPFTALVTETVGTHASVGTEMVHNIPNARKVPLTTSWSRKLFTENATVVRLSTDSMGKGKAHRLRRYLRESLVAAIKQIRDWKRSGEQGRPPYLATAAVHGVPRATLQDWVKRAEGVADEGLPQLVADTKPGRVPRMTASSARKLADWVVQRTKLNLTPSIAHFKKKAARVLQGQNMSSRRKVKLCFSNKWVGRTCRRINLSLRKPGTASARRQVANSDWPQVASFLTQYTQMLASPCVTAPPSLSPNAGSSNGGNDGSIGTARSSDSSSNPSSSGGSGTHGSSTILTYSQCPHRILNFDEMGAQKVGSSLMRVVAPKGTQPRRPGPTDDKMSITILSSGTATGVPLPNAVLMKGKCHMEDYAAAAAPGTGILLLPNSHVIDGPALQPVLDFMVKRWEDAYPEEGLVCPERRLMFLADGHSSRLNPATIAAAAARGLDIVLLPPNCSHFAQPWDQVFGTGKAYYKRIEDAWAQRQGASGKGMTKAEMIGLYSAAFQLTFKKNPTILASAWRNTGMWPFNINKPLAYMRAHGQPDKVAAAFAVSAPSDADMQQLLLDVCDDLVETVHCVAHDDEAGELPLPAAVPRDVLPLLRKLGYNGPVHIKLSALEKRWGAFISKQQSVSPTTDGSMPGSSSGGAGSRQQQPVTPATDGSMPGSSSGASSRPQQHETPTTDGSMPGSSSGGAGSRPQQHEAPATDGSMPGSSSGASSRPQQHETPTTDGDCHTEAVVDLSCEDACKLANAISAAASGGTSGMPDASTPALPEAGTSSSGQVAIQALLAAMGQHVACAPSTAQHPTAEQQQCQGYPGAPLTAQQAACMQLAQLCREIKDDMLTYIRILQQKRDDHGPLVIGDMPSIDTHGWEQRCLRYTGDLLRICSELRAFEQHTLNKVTGFAHAADAVMASATAAAQAAAATSRAATAATPLQGSTTVAAQALGAAPAAGGEAGEGSAAAEAVAAVTDTTAATAGSNSIAQRIAEHVAALQQLMQGDKGEHLHLLAPLNDALMDLELSTATEEDQIVRLVESQLEGNKQRQRRQVRSDKVMTSVDWQAAFAQREAVDAAAAACRGRGRGRGRGQGPKRKRRSSKDDSSDSEADENMPVRNGSKAATGRGPGTGRGGGRQRGGVQRATGKGATDDSDSDDGTGLCSDLISDADEEELHRVDLSDGEDADMQETAAVGAGRGTSGKVAAAAGGRSKSGRAIKKRNFGADMTNVW